MPLAEGICPGKNFVAHSGFDASFAACSCFDMSFGGDLCSDRNCADMGFDAYASSHRSSHEHSDLVHEL